MRSLWIPLFTRNLVTTCTRLFDSRMLYSSSPRSSACPAMKNLSERSCSNIFTNSARYTISLSSKFALSNSKYMFLRLDRPDFCMPRSFKTDDASFLRLEIFPLPKRASPRGVWMYSTLSFSFISLSDSPDVMNILEVPSSVSTTSSFESTPSDLFFRITVNFSVSGPFTGIRTSCDTVS